MPADIRTNSLTWAPSLLLPVYTVLFACFWVYTGLTTTNFTNWVLENTLTIPFVILLYYLLRWHPFNLVATTSIFIFLLLHVYGSQHTYAENPFGSWLRQVLHLERNHFDRVVHFSFGLLLTYPMQQLLQHKTRLAPWATFLLPLEFTLSLGALYEIVEWLVADLFYPGQGPSFLGMQGDIWDAQKDVGLALLGAAVTMGGVWLMTGWLGKKKAGQMPGSFNSLNNSLKNLII